jgi:hypothetical protein
VRHSLVAACSHGPPPISLGEKTATTSLLETVTNEDDQGVQQHSYCLDNKHVQNHGPDDGPGRRRRQRQRNSHYDDDLWESAMLLRTFLFRAAADTALAADARRVVVSQRFMTTETVNESTRVLSTFIGWAFAAPSDPVWRIGVVNADENSRTIPTHDRLGW